MIASAEGARFFQRKDIGRLLDNAKKFLRPRIVGANFAKVRRGKKSALRAWSNRRARGADRLRNSLRPIAARLHDPERDALRRARTDPWHLPQLHDQFTDRGRIFGASQSGESGSTTGAGSVVIRRRSGSRRRRYH